MRKTIASLFSAALLAAALPPPPASAMTTVTVEGTTVVIHVPVEVEGMPLKIRNVDTGEVVDDVTGFIQREVGRIWNEAFQGVKFGDCLTFRLDLQIIPVDWNAPHQAGRHRVRFSGTAKTSWWNPTGPDDMTPTDDNPFPYQRDVTGIWNTPDPSLLAHEIGHALGLGDDYYKTCPSAAADECSVTGYKPTGEAIEGADFHAGGTFTTSGVGIPDPSAVWRVIAQIKAAGLLPQCWTGTMHSDSNADYGNGFGCTGEGWDHELRFLVDRDGKVSGKATGHLVSTPICRRPFPVPDTQAKNLAFDVAGRLEGRQFELVFTETSIDGSTDGLLNYSLGLLPPAATRPKIVVPLADATTAHGDTNTSVRLAGSTASGRHAVQLKCATC